MRPGYSRFSPRQRVKIKIDNQTIDGPRPGLDRSWHCSLIRRGEQWVEGVLDQQEGFALRKKHGLQGPIDDALMDSFIFVRPSRKSPHTLVETWTSGELTRAIEHWRRHFRGDARVKADVDITADDIANANLILWGDADSNQLLKRIAASLPVRWQEGQLKIGTKSYDASHHAPIMIYPNTLNPERYVVLNSSFTYREYAYLNNARQVPMLPDWAVVDLRSPVTSQYPGKIVDADFFGEQWEIRPPSEQ